MPYQSYDAIWRTLSRIAAEHPDVVTLETIGESCEQRPIPAVRVCGDESSAPKALFVGGIHGNEKVGVAAVLRLIEVLALGYRSAPKVRGLVNHREAWLVPVINPDGYERSRRRNARGVDLNRNFAAAFARRGLLNRWRAWPFYSGPFPYSEPETQALQSLTRRIDFAVALSFHSFGGLICFPYAHSAKKAGDYGLLKMVAEEMRRRQPFERYALRQLSWLYSPRGSLEDELYERCGTVAFLIEIMRYRRALAKPGVWLKPFYWFNPTETELPRHLENNIAPALYLLEIASDCLGRSPGPSSA